MLALGAVAALTVLSACAPEDEVSSTSTPAPPASGEACAKDQLPTLEAGKLTIATDNPAYPPWFVDNEPGQR